MNLLDEYDVVAAKFKNKNAVLFYEDKENVKILTHIEVRILSDRFVERLSNAIEGTQQCFGLIMEHNPYIPSIIISLQQLHHPFIFLNPRASNEYNLKLMKKLQLKWLLCSEDLARDFLIHATFKTAIECSTTDLIQLWQVNSTNSDDSLQDVCYIIQTSATTGEPKIVKVTHFCIMSNIKSFRNIFQITEKDSIYCGTPLTFDPSIIELFLALITGALIVSVSAKIRINPSLLLNTIFPPTKKFHAGVSLLQTSPSVFLRWNESEIEHIFQKTTLRILALGGEKFPEHILLIPKSDLKIYNLYGITEVSCWASICELKETISLGEPLDDTIFKIVDENNEAMSSGVGELHIGSNKRICLINNEKQELLQTPVFRSTGDIVKKNENGIFYIGRKNNIIKRFGQRINLDHVEENIFQEIHLANCCVWNESDLKLICFINLKEFNNRTKKRILDKIHIKLLHSLSKECFPDYIEILPKIPLTENGKVDKKFLEKLYKKLKDHEKSGEDALLYLFSKYLGLSLTELEHHKKLNFFEMGGNSISIIQVITEFKEYFSSDLTKFIFEKSLEECCNYVKVYKFKKPHKRKSFNEGQSSKCIKTENNEADYFKLSIEWKYDLNGCVDSSPVIIKTLDSFLIAAGSFAHKLAILKINNGEEIYQAILPAPIESTPYIVGDNMFIGCDNGIMYCFNIKNFNIKWEYSANGRIKCTPCQCLNETAVVFGSYDKSVHCVCVKDGNKVWTTDISESITSNPLCSNQEIYIATISGTCLCLFEHSGDVKWKYQTHCPIFGSPCIINSEKLFWPDVLGTIHGFSLSDGEKLGTFKAEGNIYSSLIGYKDCLIFGCHDHSIYCLEMKCEIINLKYKTQVEAAITSTPCIFEYLGDVYIICASNAGNIYIIDFDRGNIVSKFELSNEIFSSPLVFDNRLFIGCRDNNLYCISINENKAN